MFLAKTAGGASAMSLAVGLLFAATPAMAQTPGTQENPLSTQATGSADGTNSGGEIVVTGSRIARRDLDTPAPLAVVSDAEFKQSGSVNVESVLNTLPQVVPGATAFSNNPGGGVATLNLRGLTPQRTLVLVNGRRYMFYDTSQTVDLNTIPQFLIQGVDVVTGGASAVYGSDAIAGVVNFRLRNNVQGVEVGGQYGLTGQGDGPRFDAHVAMGTEFSEGRGHITVYSEYYKRKPIFQSERDFSRFTLQDNGSGGFGNGGSSSVPGGRFTALGSDAAGNNFGAGTIYSSAGRGGLFTTPGANARAYTSADAFNYAPSNYLMVPQERWLIGGYGEYEVNEHVKAYTEVSFVNNRTDTALAATPFTGNYLVNLTAAQSYLSANDFATLSAIGARQAAAGYTFVSANQQSYTVGANQVALQINRRAIEAGLRQNHDDRNAYRVLGGLTGEIVGGWTYDASYMYARTRNAQVQSGNLSQRLIQAGLLDGSIDLFGAGSLTPGAASQITILAQNQDISTLQVADASVQGKLFNFGLGADDVALVFGGQYRKVHSQFIPDTALSSGDVVGFNPAKATEGGYDVKEAYAELSVPIIAKKPFIERLEVDARARYSDYSLAGVGGVWTYAFGAEYSPVKDITFRGQYSRAVRAPNVGELYGGASDDYASAIDFCAQGTAATNATLRALCVATGVPNSQVGNGSLQPNTQILGVTGGNANLKEERSTSYTYGVVLRPRWIPRLNVTVDYFNINVKDAVAAGGGGVANILNLCYNVIQNASSPICQLIHRNPTTGQIDGTYNAAGQRYVVEETNANLGFYKTAGIDFAADYTQPLDFGVGVSQSRINISAMATYTQKLDFQTIAGVSTISCAGKFGLRCDASAANLALNPTPKWKFNTRVSFINGPVTASVKWTRYSSVRDDDDSTLYTVEKIKAYDRFDISVAADLTDTVSVTAGVNNVADKQPPLMGMNQQQANTYPGIYDVLGRDFFVSANFRF